MNEKMGSRGLFVMIGAAAMLFLTGCPDDLPDPPNLGELAKRFAVDSSELWDYGLTQHEDRGPLTLNLYVDGSLSMAGFARPASSNYNRVCRELLEKGVIGGHSVQVSKFTDDIERLPDVAVSRLSSPGFYIGTETHLVSLLKRIAANKTEGSVHIVISDMAQSENMQDQLDMVRAMDAARAEHPEILLLGFRSSFDGEYYSEVMNGASQGNPRHLGIQRPFYLLIFAEDGAQLQRLREGLLKDIRPDQEFHASAPPLREIQTTQVSLDTLQKPGQPVLEFDCFWDPLKSPTMSAGRAGQRAYSVHWLVPAQNSAPSERLRFALGAREGCGILEGDFSVTLYAAYGPADSGEVKTLPEAKPEIIWRKHPDGQDSLFLTYDFHVLEQPPTTWRCYRAVFEAGANNLKSPDWVNEWSTDDDRTLHKAAKTLHLRLLVERLLRSCTEKVNFFDHYLVLGR